MADETDVAARKTKAEFECSALGDGERCVLGITLDQERARVRVLETVMRRYALRGNWQGNKEGHDESWVERDFGELARKVMGGDVLIPLDEAAKRDGEITQLKAVLICVQRSLDDAVLAHGDDVMAKEAASNKFFSDHLKELAGMMDLSKLLGVPPLNENTSWGGGAIRDGIEELMKIRAEVQHYQNRLSDEISKREAVEEFIPKQLQKIADALGMPKTVKGTEYGMCAIGRKIDSVMNELNALMSAVEAERLRLIEREAVVVGSPQELTLRKCNGDSVHEVANVWFGVGMEGVVTR